MGCPYPCSDASEKWWMELSTTLPKSAFLMHLWISISSRVGNLFFHFPHSFYTLSETVSSHVVFPWHNFWMILQLNLYSIPLFITGLSFHYIFSLNVSVLMFHITPNALSFSTFPLSSPLMLMFSIQCSSGIDFITSILLLTNFVKMNPPALQIFLILWITLQLHQFLLKTSACHQQECSCCIRPKFLFHYLLKFVSKHNCSNLEMKYHQIDVHTFHDLWLDLWCLRSPTTRILVSAFDPRIPLLGEK